MRVYILFSLIFFLSFGIIGCQRSSIRQENSTNHDSLFKAGQYDNLASVYAGMLYGTPQEIVQMMPRYNKVLRKTGQFEQTIQLVDSIRRTSLSADCRYALLVFETQCSMMTDDNKRTESLADEFAALPVPNDWSVVMQCCHTVSWAYYFSSSQPQVDRRMQERAIEAYRNGGTAEDIGVVLARMGFFYRREAKYRLSVDYLLEALQWYDAHPEVAPLGKIRACADLSTLYSTLELNDKAFETNAEAIRLSVRNDSLILCELYRMRSAIYFDIEQVDSGLFYLNKVDEVAQVTGEVSKNVYQRDRVKYLLQLFPDSSEVALREISLIFADSAGVRPATHSCNRYWLGLALVQNHQESRGIRLMEEAYRSFIKMGWGEMEEYTAKELLKIYAAKKMDAQLSALYPRYTVLLDSLDKQDKLRYTAAANVRYDTGRKEQENRALAAELKLRKHTLTYSWAVGGLIIALLLLLTSYIWQRNRYFRRANRLHNERISQLLSQHKELNRRNESLNVQLEQISHIDVIDAVRRELNPTLLSGEDEMRFRQSFAALYPYYLPTLRSRCPELTKSDELFCMLIMLNQSTDEVALALGISRASVNSGRSRIRKKLGLGKDESLEGYLMGVRK